MEERKSNKKTRGIIIAAMVLLLVAILCLCGTTFAKYITSTSVPTQQATVAKWGFVVNANADKLFGTGYKNTEVKAASDAGVDVKSSVNLTDSTELRDVVAPGTTGAMTFSVAGQAEVLAQITLTMKEVKEIVLKDGSGAVVYNPIKWTLMSGSDGVTYGTEVVKDTTLANIATEVAKANDKIEPGSAEVTKYYKLSWTWAFEADVTGMPNSTDEEKEAIANKIATQNRYDTLLGYAAQGADTYGDVTVTIADGVITVTDTAVSYTAEIVLAFDLSISVEQTQNKA